MTDPESRPNGISLSGWGATLRASGREVVLLLVILALGIITYRGFERLGNDRTGRMAEHRAIITAQNELACILAIPQEARPPAIMDPMGICHYVTTVYRLSERPGR